LAIVVDRVGSGATAVAAVAEGFSILLPFGIADRDVVIVPV